jgi:hypothetical protein
MDDLAVFWADRRRRLAALGGAGDTTAPTLTSPFGLPLGDTSAFQGVTTNEDNGTLYFLLTTSATPPSAAQVKAGQDHTGAAAAYAFGQAVSSTGIKSNTATGLTSNTAYYGYLMHEDAVGNQSAVSASGILTTLTTGTSDTDFDNLVAAASVAPTNLRKGYVARFIQALYAGSVWSKIDVMWVLAAHDEQFGRLNWKSPGNFTLTAVNSPTFTTDRGFAGDGSTSYLDTGWDWGTNGVGFTQNNAHHSLYQRTSGTNNPVLGLSGGTSFQNQNRARAGTDTRVTVNNGTSLDGPAGGTLPLQVIGRRADATNVSIVRDGAEVVAPTARASSSSGSTLDWLCGRAGSVYATAQIAGFAMGAYLDNTEAAAYYAAWNAYMAALGADT